MKELLKNKKYMLYWFATAFSMAASNVLQFVLSLYVLDITGSAVVFSSILSIIIIPRLLFSPIGGYIGDRFQRIKSMIVINTFTAFIILIYALFTSQFAMRTLIPVYLLVIMLEIFEVLYNGAASGLVKRLVGEDLLSQASAFATLDDGIVGLCAPIMAGFIYHFLGINGGFWLAFALMSISVILKMHIHMQEDRSIKMNEEDMKKGIIGSFISSLKIIFKHNVIWKMMLLFPVINFFLVSLFSVTNMYVLRNILKVSPAEIGFFEAVISIVSTGVPVLLIGIIKKMNPVKYFALILGVMFLSLALASIILMYISRRKLHVWFVMNVILTLTCILVITVITINIMNSVIFQVIVPDTFIGRFYSVMRMISTVSIPVGQVVYGFLSDYTPLYFSYVVSAAGIFICFMIASNVFKGYKKLEEIRR